MPIATSAARASCSCRALSTRGRPGRRNSFEAMPRPSRTEAEIKKIATKAAERLINHQM